MFTPNRIEPLVTFSQGLIVTSVIRIIEPVVTGARAEFSTRLNELCDEKGLPPKGKGRQLAVGKLFGVSQKGARKWLEGEAIPDTARMPQFSAIFDCNIDWLLAGRGAKRDTAAFNPEVLALARAIESLPTDKKGHLAAVVDAFTKSLAGESWDGVTERRRTRN